MEPEYANNIFAIIQNIDNTGRF